MEINLEERTEGETVHLKTETEIGEMVKSGHCLFLREALMQTHKQ